jgi:hypothetical protein
MIPSNVEILCSSCFSKFVGSEFDSNDSDESDLQYEKQNEPRISTVDGLAID